MSSSSLIMLFVLAIACGALGASITSGKNKGGVLGYALGFILGPIGVVVALLLPKDTPPAPMGMRAIRCPRCNAEQNVPASSTTNECWQCKLVMNG